MSDVPFLEERIEISAPQAQVWALISDVTSMSRWSPQVDSTRLRSGFDQIAEGAEFTSLNSQGELQWTTHGLIVCFEPDQKIGFRIEENWAIWWFRLEPTGSGKTLLTQSRTTPDGLSPLSRKLADDVWDGQVEFTATMRNGMRETLTNIKGEAEGSATG